MKLQDITQQNKVVQMVLNQSSQTFAKPEEFYNALIEIGAKPGENMNPNNATTTHVEGTPIKAEITWNGADKKI